MKTPLSWISLYTDISDIIAKNSISDIAHIYSTHTAEIDGIEEHFLDKVVVGKVLETQKHPESKKLSIVRVDLGALGEETILTGAQNISEATYVAVAVVGAVLPGDFVIGERMMAGMMSRGMICGADEIGMSTEESTGIMVLEDMWDTTTLDNMLGKSFFDLKLTFPGKHSAPYAYTLRDTTFEIDNKFITNRPDLFGVHGNAREWSVLFDLPFHSYESTEKKHIDKTLNVSIETPHCLAYNAIKMTDISVGKSPLGMALMMERSGLTPKIDLVDITNCILTEFGQPMHVFDADKIQGNITVRQAREGEKLVALDTKEYTLTPDDMIIADENGPIALAGIIGGMESAVSETTQNIIWESATFDAVTIRLSTQRHGIRTDASTRYEKSLDPLLSRSVLGRVFEYLKFLHKSENIESAYYFLDEKRVHKKDIALSYDFIREKSGAPIQNEKIRHILEGLGFVVTQETDAIMQVHVPSWRASKDISIKEDIAEEVMRIYGYENIDAEPLTGTIVLKEKSREKALKDATRAFFAQAGWNEVYNYSFTNADTEASLRQKDMDSAIRVQNAFNTEYTHLRRSLAGNLFANIRSHERTANICQFFEIAKVYDKAIPLEKTLQDLLGNAPQKPFGERKKIAGVTKGETRESLQEVLESYLKASIGYVPPVQQVASELHPFLHPNITASYHIGTSIVLTFGKLHPETAEKYEISENTWYFEADFETLMLLAGEKDTRFSPISRFQSIPRELNFVMDENVQTGHVAALISSEHPWIRDVEVESIYRDITKIGANKKSVNFTFLLQSDEATISDDEALTLQNTLIDKLAHHGYTLRQ